MTVDASLAGRTFPPTEPYVVTARAARRVRARHRVDVRRRRGARDLPDRRRVRGDDRPDGGPVGGHLAAPRRARRAAVHLHPAGRRRRRADRDADRRHAAPDQRRRHHRHPQRDHRRRRAAGLHRLRDADAPRGGRHDHLRARHRAADADLHRHPRRPGPLRRRQRRPQPDPLVRPGRHLGRPARRHRARDVHPGAGGPRPGHLGRRPGRVRELGCKFTKPVVVPDDDAGVEVVRARHRQERHRRGRADRARGHLRRTRRCSACRRQSLGV